MRHQRYHKDKQIIGLLFSAAQLWCICYKKWTVLKIELSLLITKSSLNLS